MIPRPYRLRRLRERLRARACDQGSLSLFFAVVTVALLMLMGLIVDGGGALTARNRAESLAQEAARAAGQQLDAAQAVQGEAIVADPDAAAAAARDYLASAGASGSASVGEGGTALSVTVHDTYQARFAGLIGMGTITVTGTAHANLHTGE